MFDLQFNQVSKRYRIQQEEELDATCPAWRRKLKSWRPRQQEFSALRDVSFAVERGEALGIIGHNGAGKSTILKLLSGITTPSAGEITINGRLAALIEVGSGFHPDLTGRENVFLNGSILGMRRREIAARLDSIIDFAGVRDFIDVPVKRYSSGMYVRLGFSIAAHLDPDILLLDEVLAVGDANFQEKCLERIRELERAGKTIVFISHDLGAVERLCDRALLLANGQIVANGAPHEVITQYRQAAVQFTASAPPKARRAGITKRAEITALKFYNAAGQESVTFTTGEPMTVRLECQVREYLPDAVLSLFFYAADGNFICHFSSQDSQERVELKSGKHVYEFYCPVLGLQSGTHYVDAAIERHGVTELVDWQYRCALLLVEQGRPVRGGIYVPHQFSALPAAEAVSRRAETRRGM